jgi:hypothetical protein
MTAERTEDDSGALADQDMGLSRLVPRHAIPRVLTFIPAASYERMSTQFSEFESI